MFALSAFPALAQTSAPTMLASRGYINGTPVTAHTTDAFNSVGASTLIVFVSSHPSWDASPVSISSVTDNVGNTWNVLVGPTTWAGSTYTLMSAIYYVHAPATSVTHTVTVNLTNPAPLVMHVVAVSGSDIGSPPIYSPITDPGAGNTSTDVISQAITVPADSFLLAWVKNETNATATARDGWTLDSASTSFLWAEHQTALSAGAYDGHFAYSNSIGWHTAIVGVKPATPAPVAQNQLVITDQDTPVNITLTAVSPNNTPLTYTVLTQPAHGQLSGVAPDLTYTPNSGYSGSDSFTFKANDGTADSNVATVSITVRPPNQAPDPTPAVVSRTGYINGTPLTVHTTAAFNSVGASTLIAFVSSHPSWDASPVSISSVTDNVGNTWNVLVGPTTWAGSTYTLMSAIYYVNAPATSVTHTVTVNLTNPAPLVMHLFAVSGSDVSGPPIYSPITDPGPGAASTDVISQAITVPADTLLLAWVKNENNATATARDGWTLDSASTSFLWAEYQTALSTGAYDGHFAYSNPIGWQTAVVGVKPLETTTPPPTPTITSRPANPSNQTGATFSFTDTQAGVSFLCQLDGSGFSACSSPKTYSGLSQSSHTFSVKAQDAAGNQSGAASFTWTIDTTAPPTPAITSTPANPTNQTSASFSFADTEADVTFFCQLDGSGFSACSSPKTYSGLTPGSHTFSVQAQDPASNQSGVASFTWTLDVTAPPTPTITSTPTTLTNQTSASFSFIDAEAGVSFLCQLDGSAFTACSSPKTYSGLTQGSHTFLVKAQDPAGNQSGAASFTWAIDTTAPPKPVITSAPPNPSNQTSATFAFTDTEASVSFLCQLDGAGLSPCSSPVTYPGPLTQGNHSFSVRARDAAGNQSGPATYNWKVNATGPPPPTITSTPANPTDQTSASFSFTDAQAGVSFLCQLDGSAFSACSSPTTYSGLILGSHTFSVKAQDVGGNQSSATSFSWTIETVPPPTITSTPANPTNQTSASFSFTDAQAGVSFLCQVDGAGFSACSSPVAYPGPLTPGSHSFAVKAQDATGNESSATSFSWTIDTTGPPTPTITSTPSNPTKQTKATFKFSDTEAGVSFLCQLDEAPFGPCSSPKTYSSLGGGSHTFSIKAQDPAGNQSGATSFTWIIR
jgi:hypothetical protein